MKRIHDFRQSFCIPLFCAVLSACSATQDVGEMLASGKRYLAAGDAKSAEIQLKNVLQKQPDSAEARYLLGKMLVENGAAAAGAVELRRALALNHPAPLVEPVLARSLLMQDQPKALIERYAAVDLQDPRAAAEVKTLLAHAYALLGEREQANAALRSALSLAPDHVEALLLEARWLVERGEVGTAFERVEKLLVAVPDAVPAWQLKGDLLMQLRNDPAAALEAYRKALSLKKDLIEVHGKIVMIALARNEPEAAGSQLQQMRSLFPGHPQTLYHEAHYALHKRDHKLAREVTQKLLSIAPEDPHVLQLAGLTEFQAGSLLQAESHLSKALQRNPELPLARRLLAQTHLRAGQPEKVLRLLQPEIDKGKADAGLLTLAAEARLQRRELEQAEALYARATQLNPQDTRSRTAWALTRMSLGEVDAATTDLERLAASDSGVTGDVALIIALLRQKRVEDALKAIEGLERKARQQPIVPYLRGMVYMQVKQLPKARASFEQALALQPTYMPAVSGLAKLDLKDGRPLQAQQRFERVVAAEPSNLRARMAVAELRARAGAGTEEISTLLLEAVKRHPLEERPRLALIDLYLNKKDTAQALRTARDAVAALPASEPLQEALGRVFLMSGDHQQAISIFSKLAAQHQESARAHLLLAGVHLATKDFASAEQSLKRAMALEPASQDAIAQLVSLYLSAGRMQDALALARSVQKQGNNEAWGFQLEGDIEAAANRWNAAIAAYRLALKKSETSMLSARLYQALLKSGSPAEAESFAQQWLRRHPQDAEFRSHLAAFELSQRNYARAERLFLQVLELQPDHVAALNNVAWALLKQGKPGAMTYAEKANQLQPGQPAILDTLAESLAQEKQWTRAVELQKKAIQLAPDNQDLRLGLARIYLGAGQRTQAREELDRLRMLGNKFSRQSEVEQMLKSL